MALEVIQRPEEELFTQENPTIYDTPYYTSRFNAANLPLVYKISNTKFPVNSEDAIESITSVSNNGGFAQLVLNSATYNFLNKGYVEVTNTNSYNGVWQIIEDIDLNNIVINAPFVADEIGNVQNYYNNYSTLVKVYAGLPEYHPLNTTKPLTLITDNPITVTPNSDNEATVDVSALVKSQLNLNNDYDLNDIDLFNAFYIEYSEQYDESDGTTVSVTTEAFTEDLIEGCDPTENNFVTNGDFTTNLNDWANVGAGETWVYSADNGGEAQVTLSAANRGSSLLQQDALNLTEGTQYDLSFDYNIGTNAVTITVFSGSVIYQEELSGSGTVNIEFISEGNDTLSFTYFLNNNPASAQTFSLDNVVLLNILTNPCLAYIFSSHSALQPQAKYGGNMGEYVQNFNGGVFANKWLTLMQEPVLFEGNYFDLSTIIPQAVIQAAIQAGGFFLQIIEFDKNGTVIEETNYPITQNLGDGIYRFRLDDKTFNTNTKKFTAQILRIPVNLFVDGDQGTFDTTTDPTGNPPSDWNLEKDPNAVVNFEDTIVQAGSGALYFNSRTIFNDNFAFKRQANTAFDEDATLSDDNKTININLGIQLPNFNSQDNFKFTFDFYPTEFYSNGNVNIWNFFLDGGQYIRFASGSSSDNKPNVTINKGGVTTQLLHTEKLVLNSLNTIEFEIVQGTSFSLTVNGVTLTNTDGLTITVDYTILLASDINYGGVTNRPVRGAYGDTILESGGVKRYEFKFNQDSRDTVFESVTESFFDILDRYADATLELGGGAWVDTTLL